MHHLSRLDKAFLRKGIQLSRANNIVSLSCPIGASVHVLLLRTNCRWKKKQ